MKSSPSNSPESTDQSDIHFDQGPWKIGDVLIMDGRQPLPRVCLFSGSTDDLLSHRFRFTKINDNTKMLVSLTVGVLFALGFGFTASVMWQTGLLLLFLAVTILIIYPVFFLDRIDFYVSQTVLKKRSFQLWLAVGFLCISGLLFAGSIVYLIINGSSILHPMAIILGEMILISCGIFFYSDRPGIKRVFCDPNEETIGHLIFFKLHPKYALEKLPELQLPVHSMENFPFWIKTSK